MARSKALSMIYVILAFYWFLLPFSDRKINCSIKETFSALPWCSSYNKISQTQHQSEALAPVYPKIELWNAKVAAVPRKF